MGITHSRVGLSQLVKNLRANKLVFFFIKIYCYTVQCLEQCPSFNSPNPKKAVLCLVTFLPLGLLNSLSEPKTFFQMSERNVVILEKELSHNGVTLVGFIYRLITKICDWAKQDNRPQLKKYMSDQTVILPKWLTHWGNHFGQRTA